MIYPADIREFSFLVGIYLTFLSFNGLCIFNKYILYDHLITNLCYVYDYIATKILIMLLKVIYLFSYNLNFIMIIICTFFLFIYRIYYRYTKIILKDYFADIFGNFFFIYL